MQADLHPALAYVFADEGGYAERADEGGGAVNKGITFAVFVAWRKIHNQPVPTFEDLKNISDDEASAIYVAQYAEPLAFSYMPAGLDYCLLNTGVMQGVTGAIELLQQALMVKVDGHLGLVTWNAVKSHAPHLVVPAVLRLQLNLKKANPHWFDHTDAETGKTVKGFGPGWTARLMRVETRAMSMIATVMAAKVPADSILKSAS